MIYGCLNETAEILFFNTILPFLKTAFKIVNISMEVVVIVEERAKETQFIITSIGFNA